MSDETKPDWRLEKPEWDAAKQQIADMSTDIAVIKKAVCKTDGKTLVDLLPSIPSQRERGGVVTVLALLVLLTIARMLGLQVPG